MRLEDSQSVPPIEKITMVQKRFSFWVSLRIFIVVSLLTEGFTDDASWNFDSYMDQEKTSPCIPTVEDNDPNYPYEQLLQLVKDTKRILNSSNFTEKMRLNLDPQIYDYYLSGDLSDFNYEVALRPSVDGIPSSIAGGAYSPAAASVPYNMCVEDVQYQIPRRLPGIDGKDYFIINVGSELRQKYNSVICKNPNGKCGSLYGVQGYSYTCEQSYNRIRNFVSIPVGNQISVDQQRLQLFRVPDGCSCKTSRNQD